MNLHIWRYLNPYKFTLDYTSNDCNNITYLPYKCNLHDMMNGKELKFTILMWRY